jgi:hypothetical protein
MIVLPSYPPRRAWLTGFGVVIGALLAAVGSLAGALLFPAAIAPAVIAGAGVVMAGWFFPQSMATGYRLWNGAAYRLAIVARAWLLWVSFRLVLAVVGLAARDSSALMLDPGPRASLWRPCSKSGASSRHGGSGVYRMPRGPSSQFRVYLAWMRETGHWWALALAPFLVLLSACEEEPTDGRLQENVYTLF